MPSLNVTKADREAAARIVDSDIGAQFVFEWIESGEDMPSDEDDGPDEDDAEAFYAAAHAIATARSEGRASMYDAAYDFIRAYHGREAADAFEALYDPAIGTEKVLP